MSRPMVCVDDFEKKAEQILEKEVAQFINSGAGEEFSLKNNRKAFRRLRICPKYFQEVTKVGVSCKILGFNLQWPLGIAPSAVQKWSHPDGESGIAKAAGQMGSIYILSSFASTSIEEVAKAAPDTIKWFQIYTYKDRTLIEDHVRRAEKANFKALVLTLDNSIVGQRWIDERNCLQLPTQLTFANFNQSYEYIESMKKPFTLNDIKWLKQFTHLPLIAKGILTAEGAILARDAGCAGVIVSSHGGRHLDGQHASVEALPDIVKAVADDMVVMLDSGIRSGNDIFKALALGAKMVFIGRPAVWGLACGGEEGVRELLKVLYKDLVKVMTLAGCENLKAIERNMVKYEECRCRL